jgi:formate dehydrogenase iron-sulfur subunit
MANQTNGAPARPSGLSRRQFFKLSAGAAAAGAAGACLGCPAIPAFAEGADPATALGVLIDLSRCVGCNSCQRACTSANDLHPTGDELNTLSAETYTYVQREDLGDGQTRFIKRACMHCLHPACVGACTVGALHQTPEGVIVFDDKKCIGCRYCQYACPFSVPQFEWEKTLGTIRKCQSCIERLRAGEQPACVAACPAGTLKYGKRADLLLEAHARIKGQPDFYIDHVYGEHEVGGTGRLYISDVSFAALGFPMLDTKPVPENAEAVMSKTPIIAASVAAAATLIFTTLRFRDENLRHPKIEVEQEDR